MILCFLKQVTLVVQGKSRLHSKGIPLDEITGMGPTFWKSERKEKVQCEVAPEMNSGYSLGPRFGDLISLCHCTDSTADAELRVCLNLGYVK